MKNKKPALNENVFGAIKKFTDAFFDGLKNNTANQIIKKAESAKLPDRAIKAMREMEERSAELKRIMNEL